MPTRSYTLTDGWLFCKLPDCTPETFTFENLPEKSAFQPVSLPHTWYSDDDQYRGLTAYRRKIVWDGDWDLAFLSFEGADQRCLVYADGELLSEHRGAYSRFRTGLKRPASGVTELTVLLDNRPDETISPHFGDFTVFGGLYRPVELIVCGQEHFDYTYHGTNGVIARTELSDRGDGLVRLESRVCTERPDARVVYTLLDPRGKTAAFRVAPAGESVTIEIERPVLWNGRRGANLYTLYAVLRVGGAAVDMTTLRLGFRSLSLSAEEGLFLNGEHVRLHGVAKHQDIGLKYSAVSADEIRADFDLIDDIGANAVRLSHYQHAQTAG